MSSEREAGAWSKHRVLINEERFSFLFYGLAMLWNAVNRIIPVGMGVWGELIVSPVYPVTSTHRVWHEIIILENKYRMVAPSFHHSPWNPPEIFVRTKIGFRLIWRNGEGGATHTILWVVWSNQNSSSLAASCFFAAIVFLAFVRPVCFTFYLNKVSVFSLSMSLYGFLQTRLSKFTDASDPA